MRTIELHLINHAGLWQSNRIYEAIKQAEFAIMAARDLVRLVELGKDARSQKRWIPSDCEANELQTFDDEKGFFQSIKSDIRSVFYEITDYEFYPSVNIDSNFDINEFQFYAKRLQLSLYDCDRILGLRLGELTY